MPTVSDYELESAAGFRSALRRFLARSDEITAATGLTQQRYDLLLAIKTGPGERTTVTDLCRQLTMTQTAVSELVKRSEQAGLVQRSSSPTDGRVSVLALTPAGEQRLIDAFVALRDERRQLFEAVNRLGSSFRALMHSHDEVAR